MGVLGAGRTRPLVKVFAQAFFKKLAEDKGGRRPLLCSAACRKTRATRSKIRNAKQKGRASQKQRSEFLAAPFYKAPPGRQKSEREFCLFGRIFLRPVCRAVCRGSRLCAARRCCGGFCARCPGIFLPVFRCFVPGLWAACCFCAWSGLCCRGLLAVCPPCVLCAHFRLVSAVCSPVLCCVRGFSLLSFTFSCLTFASQISFHLSLRPRRASTFFRKESRQRFAKGLRPFEPHSCALRPFFPSSALLAGLRGLRPQTAG